MSKLLLNREKRYMEFVEMCSNKAFPEQLSAMLYFEKSLFLRICAGQKLLRILFRKGNKERILKISQYGPQRFFLELLIIHYNIPLFLAKILFKIKSILSLLMLSLNRSKNDVYNDLSTYKKLTFLITDFNRLTNRFVNVITNAENICEVHSNCKVKLVGVKQINFSLPQLTISQFFSVLFAPSWKTTYLVRAFRQYNFIIKYNINNVYIIDGDSPTSVSSAYAAYLANTISTCVQWGTMAMGIKPGYKLFPFNYYLCTGQYYVDLLSPFSKKTKFLIYPYINNFKYIKETNFNRCKSVLFVLSESDTAISKKETYFLINLCAETKKRFPNLNITARPHPDMILNENSISLFKKHGVIIDNSTSPDIALSKNKFIVGLISSLMIESLDYDCFPIFMEFGLKQLYPDLLNLSAAMKFETKKQWFEILDNLLKNYCDYKVEPSLKKSLNNKS